MAEEIEKLKCSRCGKIEDYVCHRCACSYCKVINCHKSQNSEYQYEIALFK